MELKALPTDIVLSESKTVLGHLKMDRSLYPGTYIDIDGHTYQILVRRHQYQLKLGRYHLHKAIVHVKKTVVPEERSLLNGTWVIGDTTCTYNARSELMRCAVNPIGPCQGCIHYSSIPSHSATKAQPSQGR
ncbi:MAG: hypothetical protein DCF15_20450 [Phormidesmis priestleyi]|uniref:Uncharacterized protein n=1 Tax=Phormidesmis priestleyi TaxID=268141 RepID=A0A2W4YIA8_9CYAN|nr:MAG: hypothetical protein DCF15_20450 [Phormidesmis priestleyi]